MFTFFGVVATAGSAYVQTDELWALPLVASVPVGLWATALLVINNLRDIPGDTASGKRTLAVRIGDARTRWLYVAMLVVAFGCIPIVAGGFDRPGAAAALVGVVLARQPVLQVLGAPPAPPSSPSSPPPAGSSSSAAPSSPAASGSAPRASHRSAACGSPGHTIVGPHRGTDRRRPLTWPDAASEVVVGEPGLDDREEAVGLLEVGGVAGALDEGERGVGADLGGQALREGGELGVVGAGEDEHRHVEAVELVPGRVLRAGAGLLEARPQPVDGVLAGAPARNDRSGGRPAKSGWASQSSRNASKPVALDAGGGGQVLLAALLALARGPRCRRWRRAARGRARARGW